MDAIEANQRAIRDGHCGQTVCARCRASGPFAPHELRRRQLRIIVDNVVRVVSIVISRWRCRRCRYVFTDYPDFRTPLQAVRQS